MSDKESFIKIPIKVLKNFKLSDFQKILYGQILMLTHSKGYCFASNSTLSRMLGKKSNDTITRGLKKLREEKYIEIKNYLGPDRKIYILGT